MTVGFAGETDVARLVAGLTGARVLGALPARAAGVAHDSRAVEAGTIFVALRGERHDGHAFAGAALANGASLLVIDDAYARAHALPPGAPVVAVPDTRRALSTLAAAWYGRPSQRLAVAGVTGTNGKTTTTHLLAAICAEAGSPAGVIGTLGARYGDSVWPLDNTTPLSLELQALLAAMRVRGARHVAMEVSSHALAQERVADVAFETAVLTNVTRDHLDFHGTFEAYAAAKRSLFTPERRAVLNAGDALGARWADELTRAGGTVVRYGFERGADLQATDVRVGAQGSTFCVDGRRFELSLPGRFNIENALAALGVSRGWGIDDAVGARALARFERVPGRMEHFAAGGIDVLVDYAHTPDALERVLHAARETAHGALAVVFGCGGDRDRGKRPQMGRIAECCADRVYVTSDNPRGEEPRAIIADILAGMTTRDRAVIETDRRSAIRRAIGDAAPGDVIVVAGKGHERYQITGGVTAQFDDREEVRAALALRAPERA